MVHGILLVRVPPGDVDDLVQDVFLIALRKLQSLRDARSFGGWLAAIARNRARDHHRQRSSTVVEWSEDLSWDTSESGPAGGAGGNAIGASEAAAILAVIQSLPDAYKETLVLRLVEGMTGLEIAARTGLTPGSVRVNLHRGMEQLRLRLERMSSRGEPPQEKSSS